MNHIYVKIYEDRIEFYIAYNERNKSRQIKNNEIILPVSFTMGDRLYYIKKMISSVIDQYNVQAYNLEIDSDMGLEIVDAVKVEGVLEELFSSKGVMLWK